MVEVGRGDHEVPAAGDEPPEIGRRRHLTPHGLEVRESPLGAVRAERRVEWFVSAAHPVGEDVPLDPVVDEGVGVGPERQPLEAAARVAVGQFVVGFSHGHEARVEASEPPPTRRCSAGPAASRRSLGRRVRVRRSTRACAVSHTGGSGRALSCIQNTASAPCIAPSECFQAFRSTGRKGGGATMGCPDNSASGSSNGGPSIGQLLCGSRFWLDSGAIIAPSAAARSTWAGNATGAHGGPPPWRRCSLVSEVVDLARERDRPRGRVDHEEREATSFDSHGVLAARRDADPPGAPARAPRRDPGSIGRRRGRPAQTPGGAS